MNNVSTNKKKHEFLKSSIREELSLIFLTVLAIITYILAKNHKLTPILMILCITCHFFICSLTNFQEDEAPSYLHFNRSIEGIILISMVVTGFSYFFTYIFDGGLDIESSIKRAELCTQLSYYMLLWPLLAGISLIGLYFVITSISRWFPFIVQEVQNLETPFILYIEVIIIGLLALGTWLTYTILIYNALFKKEEYGKMNEIYAKASKNYLIFHFFMGIIFILFESNIFEILIEFLKNDKKKLR